MNRQRRWSIGVVLLTCFSAGAATADQPGIGFPFRGAPHACVPVDRPAHVGQANRRWFVQALADYRGRPDGCHVNAIHRYSVHAEVWAVRLSCGGAIETWTLNYDGSITADRNGHKTTYYACGSGRR